MKFFTAACAIALWIAAVPTAIPAPSPDEPAKSAALAWLGLVDAGNYDLSWASASSLFRQNISQSQWRSAAASARAPLGTLISRKLLSATPKNAVPGAPDGQYLVLQFVSSFEHKASATETVTPVMDTDGEWHVSGYYIQ